MNDANKTKYILASCAIFFFLVYLFLSIGKQMTGEKDGFSPPYLIFNQPDESANYFFLRSFVLDGKFGVPEPLAQISNNQVHARSMTVVQGHLVPIGFPTMIVLFGFFIKTWTTLFGDGVFNYLAVGLTPLLAAIAPLFFYGFLRRIFSQQIALLSALLLFVLPPWWYYASRSLQTNTIFVTLLIVALYAWIRVYRREKYPHFFSAISGLAFGLAVAIRPSEIVWVSIVCAATVIFSWKKSRLTAKGAWLLAGALGVTFLFLSNLAYYGHPLHSGYVKPLDSGESGSILSGPQGISFFQALVAPFGINPISMLKTGYDYSFYLFPIWFILSAISFIWLCLHVWKTRERPLAAYLLLYVAVSVCLLVYYGSWRFADNLAGEVSIGSSQARYFLPLYVFALPYVANVIGRICHIGRIRHISRMVMACLVIFLVFLSWRAVFLQFEGLYAIRDTIHEYENRRADINSLTEPDSIIVTRYADKYLFPGRKIIAGATLDVEHYAISDLAKSRYSVYWYDLPGYYNEAQLIFGTAQLLHGMELRKIYPPAEL